MQRFVRSTLAGLVSLAALAALSACGTKETTTVEPNTNEPATITSVTVSPSSATLTLGTSTATIALAATVTADSALPRTVTWSSGNTAIATVNATSGVVTAVAAGTTTITATSTFLASATGSASITVLPAPTTPVTTVTPASINVASILQGPCPTCAGAVPPVAIGSPVDLTNVQGQVNVNVNYDPGTTTVTSVMVTLPPTVAALSAHDTCGVINVASSRVHNNSNASASAAATGAVNTLTFTCNTAAFDTTQTVQGNITIFKNGQYTIAATLFNPTAGTAPATEPLALNNVDFMRVNYAPPTVTALDANGFSWRSGSVVVKTIPILYTNGRTIATANISLVNGSAHNVNGLGTNPNAAIATNVCGVGFTLPIVAGVCTAAPGTVNTISAQNAVAIASPWTTTFSGTSKAAGGLLGVSADSIAIVVTSIDGLGNSGPGVTAAQTLTGPGGQILRVDNLAPPSGYYSFVTIAAAGAPPPPPGVGAPYAATVADSNNQGVSAPTAITAWAGLTYTFVSTAKFGYLANPFADGYLGTASAVATVPATPSIGVGKTTVVFQEAAAGTAKTGTWTTVTAASAMAATASATAYNLRMLETDALGNTDTTTVTSVPFGGAGTTVTFGVDLRAPTAVLTTATATENSIAANKVLGIGQIPAFDTLSVTATDSALNGVAGSGFSATPLSYSIQKLLGGVPTCFFGSGSASTCSPKVNTIAPTLAPALAPTGTAQDGQYRVQWFVTDLAGNTTATTTTNYYLDFTAPVIAAVGTDIAIPAAITSGAIFTTSGNKASDNLNLAGGNGSSDYEGIADVAAGCPGAPANCTEVAGQIKFAMTGATTATGGVPFSATSESAAALTGDVSVTLSNTAAGGNFFRGLYEISAAGAITGGVAGTKPDSMYLRAVDAAQNQSIPVAFQLPGANISPATAAPFTAGVNLTTFVDSGTAVAGVIDKVSVGGHAAGGSPATLATSTTFTGLVKAPSGVVASPFASVCFFYQNPIGPAPAAAGLALNNTAAGEYVLIGCSATPTVTTDINNNRYFSYTQSWTPATSLSGSTVNVVAVGLASGAITGTSSLDGLLTDATQVIIVP